MLNKIFLRASSLESAMRAEKSLCSLKKTVAVSGNIF